MSMSSYCRNCGLPNSTVAEMSSNHCNGCEEARKGAMQHHVEKNPGATDVLYAGRMALMQRARHSRETFVNPRDFDRADMKNR